VIVVFTSARVRPTDEQDVTIAHGRQTETGRQRAGTLCVLRQRLDRVGEEVRLEVARGLDFGAQFRDEAFLALFGDGESDAMATIGARRG
jgi:hypothetical protein